MLLRAILLWRYTTKQLDEEMSHPDLELLINTYDLLQKREMDLMAVAVNKALVGDK